MLDYAKLEKGKYVKMYMWIINLHCDYHIIYHIILLFNTLFFIKL